MLVLEPAGGGDGEQLEVQKQYQPAEHMDDGLPGLSETHGVNFQT